MDDVKTVTYGAWTRIEGRAFVGEGELLAAENEYLALSRDDHVTLVPSGCIERVKLAAFEGAPEQTGLWGAAGSMSTASHGFFFVFSLPIWLVTTGSATYAHSKAGILQADYHKSLAGEIDKIRKWSRFPQGLPPAYLEQAKAVHHLETSCRSANSLPIPGLTRAAYEVPVP